MDQRISLVTLAVKDVAAARRFYADGLGWTAGFDHPGVVMFQVGEFVILSLWAESEFEAEVGPLRRGEGLAPMALAHNVSSREEVDAVLETARQAGARSVTPALDRDWGGYSGYFADPDGFRWEVAWAPVGGIVENIVPPRAPTLDEARARGPAERAVGPGPAEEPQPVRYEAAFAVDDAELSSLHARAFGGSPAGAVLPWRERLERHSLTWVGAFRDGHLVGFVHAPWDGGAHAFLVDLAVDPAFQRQGIGQELVRHLREQVREAGCEWLHVDYEPHLDAFYRACGFRPIAAGLLKLR